MADVSVLRRLLVVCLLAGLALSVYAALETLDPALQGTCTVNSYISCGKVAQSPYSFIGPLPVWSLGVGGFVVLLALTVLHVRSGEARWLSWLWIFAVLGLVATVALFAVEVFLINALCPVCISSYVAEWAVLGVVWRLSRETPGASARSSA